MKKAQSYDWAFLCLLLNVRGFMFTA